MVAAGLVAAAPAAAPADQFPVTVSMSISNLRQGMYVDYDAGFRPMGGQVTVDAGNIAGVTFAINGFLLTPQLGSTFRGSGYQLVVPASAGPITGTAGIPSGASVSASAGGAAVKLVSGRFSLPTGDSRAGLGSPGSNRLTLHCRGTPSLCRVRLSLAGGASDKRVVVRLPAGGLRLRSVLASRSDLRGAYNLSASRYRPGGAGYAFTFNAVNAIGRGAYLTLTFRRGAASPFTG